MGLQPSDTAPFSEECINRELDTAGYAPAGSLRPAKKGMDYWNKLGAWQQVLDTIAWWKNTADTDAADPTTQAGAIQNVYGVGIRWPKTGCNIRGTEILRYALQNADPATFGTYPAGPQTHFLGRVLQGAGLSGAGIMQSGTSGDMIPGTGSAAEANRHIAIFRPSVGGTYQFLMNYDDAFQMTLLDSTGNTVVQYGNNLLTGGNGWGYSNPVSLIAGQEYRFVLDFRNIIATTWSMLLQASINGAAWAPLSTDQFYLPADRRQPLLELAFHRMPAGTKGDVKDTNGILQNWTIYPGGRGVVGSVAGQPCLVVSGSGSYCGNFAKYSQGIRMRALKSYTMKLYVQSGSATWPGGYTPSFFALYNLPSTNTSGPLRVGAPSDSWNWQNRTADFDITTNGSRIYPYGTQQRGGGDTIQGTFLANVYGGSPTMPVDRWFHLAFVWADDFTSYAMYIDGKLVANLPAAAYDPALIMESIRIGCDGTDDMAEWKGGVAWFRGFDYRLSGDLVQRDMADDWASLI